MPSTKGIRSSEAGQVSSDGFIVPPQGRIEHTFYFNTAPCSLSKAEELIAKGKVHFPAAVVVNNETFGRRTGSKAVCKSWWADPGSIAAAFAFAPRQELDEKAWLRRCGRAVIEAFNEFNPTAVMEFRSPNDLYIADRKAGRVLLKRSEVADIAVVHLNCTTDLAKASAAIGANAGNLVEFIDAAQLPMGRPEALGTVLLQKLMTTLPRELER
jgi:biotin-(acetyl-CoA carboxylase) ligase